MGGEPADNLSVEGSLKSIFEYTDYRKYLADWCTHARAKGKAFSFRNFSRMAGIASPSYLKMVIDGKRNILPETIAGFARALRLTAAQARFFEDLVLFNQARTHEAKDLYYHRLLRCRKFRAANHLSRERYEYFSKWYYAAIREMVALPDFRPDPAWIAKRLRPQVTRAEAQAALELLERLGLVAVGKDGRMEICDGAVTTEDEVNSLVVVNYHKEMIGRAADSLTSAKGKERNISALTVAMSKQKFQQIKERIHAFRKEIRALLGEADDAEDVYQINFQLFSLTGATDEA